MKRKIFTIFYLSLLTILFQIKATPLFAEVLINTQILDYCDYDFCENNQSRIAQSFQTSANITRLTEVHINLFKYEAGSPTGTFYVDLWGFNNTTQLPTSLITNIGSGNIESLPTNVDNVVSFTGLNIAVNPNTDYYIIVRVISGSSDIEYFAWGYYCTPGGGGGLDPDTYYTYSSDGGSSWDPDPPETVDPQRMRIVGVGQLIPTLTEWGIISLSVIFAGIGCWFIWRRRMFV
jgi:hypothetical protein